MPPVAMIPGPGRFPAIQVDFQADQCGFTPATQGAIRAISGMKIAGILVGSFAMCLVASCHRGFDFDKAYQTAYHSYFGPDQARAKNVLLAFVTEAERNESTARTTSNPEHYDRTLAMSWLRLSSCYFSDGESRKGNDAILRAIRYFDRDPQISGDAGYRQDKRRWVKNFLEAAETDQRPLWKRQIESARFPAEAAKPKR